ncbi:hypothetical protein A3770_18p82880 [Chloropicon primus]|uniref:Sister chromatid cohesion protein n=2 Tax=Chloropicon primus TaxID=1764295 RepID=A0A5B8N1Q0_9CHLO|nr:hypothetical protein A3770_18p82880 [Chloropicon primus]|eukprot:QDZ25770.1 hypothetical protein A3770_18p82880 [Chloropicon primus]
MAKMAKVECEEDGMEVVLECGSRVRRYAADIHAKSDTNTKEVLELLYKAEQVLRRTKQGDKDMKRAVANTFSKAIVQVLTSEGKRRSRGGAGERSGGRRGAQGSGEKTRQQVDGEVDRTTTPPSLALLVSARCACCFVLLLRLFAPNCPFPDKDMEKVLSKGLFAKEGGLVARLCRSLPAEGAVAARGKTPSKERRFPAGRRDDLEEAWSEVYDRGLFILDTLREVKALLLCLDFASDDCLCCVLESLFACITERNVSEIKGVVLEIAGELLEEGGADLGPNPWETLLVECVGRHQSGLPELERRIEAVTGAVASSGAGGIGGDTQSEGTEDSRALMLKQGEMGSSSATVVARELLRRNGLALGPHVQKFLDRLMTGCLPCSDLNDDCNYHALMYSLYVTSPKIMLPVLPKLQMDLTTTRDGKRLGAVELVGHFLISDFGPDFAREYNGSLFQTFLDRFHDKSSAIRSKATAIAECFIVRHMRDDNNLLVIEGDDEEMEVEVVGESDKRSSSCVVSLLHLLADRIVDQDEKVRKRAVRAVGHILSISPSALSGAQYENFYGRLRDTKISVRQETCAQLARIFCCHIQRVHNDGGSWRDEERAQIIPGLLLKAYKEDKALRSAVATRQTGLGIHEASHQTGPVLEEALCTGLWPENLEAEEVLRHWVVIVSTESFDAIDGLEPPKLLSKCIQIKMALRNSLKQLLMLREEGRTIAESGVDDDERKARWAAKCSMQCQKVAKFWLNAENPEKSSASLQRILDLKDNKVIDGLVALTECEDGERALEIKSTLMQAMSYNKDLQAAVSQVCNYLAYSPIQNDHVKALLTILLSKGTEPGGPNFILHCRDFAVRLAAADSKLFHHPGARNLLLQMLLDERESVSLLGLELLDATHRISHRKASGRDQNWHLGSGSSEEAALMGLVSDRRREVSTKAIALVDSVLDENRAQVLLKEEAKKSLRLLNESSGGSQDPKETARAFCVIGNIASVAPHVLKESTLDVVTTVCSVLTNPLPPPPPGTPVARKERRGGRRGRASPPKGEKVADEWAPHDLFVAAVTCLGDVFCPRSPYLDVSDDVKKAVPSAMQYVVNQLELENPLIDDSGLASEQKAQVRLAAAKAILQVIKRHDNLVSFKVYQDVCLVMQDPSKDVRRAFAAELNSLVASFQATRPPQVPKAAKYAAALALAGADPNKENKALATNYLIRYIVHACENMKRGEGRDKSQRDGVDRNYPLMRPEFVLVFAIHLLAHHSDYPTKDDLEDYGVNEPFLPFQQMLLFFLEILSHGEYFLDSSKGGLSKRGKEKAKPMFQLDAGLVQSILRTVKNAGDAIPAAAESSIHVIADLAWLLTERLCTTDQGDRFASDAPDHRVPLPRSLYKVHHGSERSKHRNSLGSSLPEGLEIMPIEEAASGKGRKSKSPKRRSSGDGATTPSPGRKKRKTKSRRKGQLSPLSSSEFNSGSGKGGFEAQSPKRSQPKRSAKAKAKSQIKEQEEKENRSSSSLSLGVSL